MTLRTGSGEPRDVAVGATREEAAGTFGEYFDNAFFTSYDDFDAEVDLSLLRSLGLVAGDGLTAVLPRVLASHNVTGASHPRVVVGLTPEVDRREVVERMLANHPSVTFTQVLESGDNVLVPLEAVGGSTPGARDTLLGKMPVAPPHRASAGTVQHDLDEPPRASLPQAVAGPHAGAPAGPWGRRRLLLVATVLSLLTLMMLTLAALVEGADGVLLVGVLFLVASQCAMLLGLLYVVRVVRTLGHERDEQVAFREQMSRRTSRLVRLSKESVRLQRENMAAVQKARTEIAGVRNRVMALGKLLSRAGAAARETQAPE